MTAGIDETPESFNLNDTSRCPVAERCDTCDSTRDLAVATHTTPAGVCCGTFCLECRAIILPALTCWPGDAAELVLAHRSHVDRNFPPYQHGDLVTVASAELVVDEHCGDQVTVCSEDGAVGFTVHQDEVSERLILDEGGDLIEHATATFNAVRTHRYQLTRTWDRDRAPVVFLLLNPSVADAFVPDPTITRCLGFARRENAGGLVVANLFALRSTDPSVLAHHGNPIGHSNNRLIVESVQDAAVVIAGWGVPGQLAGRDREVCALLAEHGIELKCLGRNKDGSPKHPLYVRATQPLEPYRLEIHA